MIAPRCVFVVVAALAAAGSAPAAEPGDAAMLDLARRVGCNLCHEVPVRQNAPDQRPFAPGWRAIAARYRGDPGAEDRLTGTVIGGTGRLLTDRHWRGQVTFSEMPNNDIQLTRPDARALVRWILARPN